MLSNHRNNLFVFFLLLFVSFSAAFAQSAQESYTILGISVEGNKYSDKETIVALSGLRAGDQISIPSDNKLNTAIRNLWKRKQFSNVDIVIEKITPMGIFLTIQVEEFARLNKIIFEGNKELNDEELREGLGKVRGDIISGYGIYLIKQEVKKLYEEEGLLFATVETRSESSDSSNYLNLYIVIEEGTEFYVRKIEFEGNENFDDDDLADAFEETHTRAWWEFWRSAKFDKEEYEADLDLLRDFFRSEGYIDAQILSDSIVYNEENQSVHLNITVDEGQRVYIRNIDFAGNTVYPAGMLLNRLDFEKGEPYDMIRFEENLLANEDQTDVASLYMDNGYLAARFEKEEKRVALDSVDVIVNIFENQRVKIRRVDIVGNTKTKDKVIRRELYTRPGDYFNRSAIIRSVKALGVLQYFNPEALRPDVKPVDNTSVDLVYTVEEQSTDTFNASIGFAGTFGLTGAIGMTFNNFSLTEPLRGGGGQVLNFSWEFGQASRYQTFSLGFSEPWLFDEPTTVGFNLYSTKYNYFYYLKRTGLALNLGRRFRWPDDYFRGDLSLRVQENDIGTTTSPYYRPGKNTEITVGASISRISLNNLFFPTSGSKFSVSSNFAMGTLGLGTTDYLKNEVNFEILSPLMRVQENDRMVLYLSTKMGYITGFESDTAISPIELYYMGGNGLSGFGVTPLRGYDDRQIGPTYGGRVMMRHIAELRFAISVHPMPIYVYGFAEAGNVWNKLQTTDPFDLKRAAGIGVQLMINPIGIIGFSYGYGFDPDRSGEKSGWKFLFHLGQGF